MTWQRDDSMMVKVPMGMPERDVLRLATLKLERENIKKVYIDVYKLSEEDYQIILLTDDEG